jgi:hypothetical protein
MKPISYRKQATRVGYRIRAAEFAILDTATFREASGKLQAVACTGERPPSLLWSAARM